MRTYKPRQPKSRRGRMIRAAGMRGEGMSLRQIAAELGVSHDTAWRDLRRWDEENAKITNLSDRGVRKTPPGGGNLTAPSDSESATVLPMRRTS